MLRALQGSDGYLNLDMWTECTGAGEVTWIIEINGEEVICISGLNVIVLYCKPAFPKFLNNTMFEIGKSLPVLMQ